MGFWSSLQPRSEGRSCPAVNISFPELLRFPDLALLLLRLVVAGLHVVEVPARFPAGLAAWIALLRLAERVARGRLVAA